MTARILIVDDVPANTRLLEAKLSAEYYQVASARDGFEALRMAHEWQPDLILLDVMMPGRDGWQVCREMKDHPTLGSSIRVIMVTALQDWMNKRQALETGADDFVEKPFELAALAKVVERNAARLPAPTS